MCFCKDTNYLVNHQQKPYALTFFGTLGTGQRFTPKKTEGSCNLL